VVDSGSTAPPAGDGGEAGSATPDASDAATVTDTGYSPTSCPLTSGHPTCPPAYVCSCPAVGATVPVCAAAGALSPPQCTQNADCADIPGATCQVTGGGVYCILACSPP
jgi:hypothetical protein